MFSLMTDRNACNVFAKLTSASVKFRCLNVSDVGTLEINSVSTL